MWGEKKEMRAKNRQRRVRKMPKQTVAQLSKKQKWDVVMVSIGILVSIAASKLLDWLISIFGPKVGPYGPLMVGVPEYGLFVLLTLLLVYTPASWFNYSLAKSHR